MDQKNTISQAVEAGSGHERHRRVPSAAFGTAFILVLALIGLTYVLRSETSPLVDEPVAETTTPTTVDSAPTTTAVMDTNTSVAAPRVDMERVLEAHLSNTTG